MTMQAFSLAIVRLFYWLHFLSVCDSFFANYYFTLSAAAGGVRVKYFWDFDNELALEIFLFPHPIQV